MAHPVQQSCDSFLEMLLVSQLTMRLVSEMFRVDSRRTDFLWYYILIDCGSRDLNS